MAAAVMHFKIIWSRAAASGRHPCCRVHQPAHLLPRSTGPCKLAKEIWPIASGANVMKQV